MVVEGGGGRGAEEGGGEDDANAWINGSRSLRRRTGWLLVEDVYSEVRWPVEREGWVGEEAPPRRRSSGKVARCGRVGQGGKKRPRPSRQRGEGGCGGMGGKGGGGGGGALLGSPWTDDKVSQASRRATPNLVCDTCLACDGRTCRTFIRRRLDGLTSRVTTAEPSRSPGGPGSSPASHTSCGRRHRRRPCRRRRPRRQ